LSGGSAEGKQATPEAGRQKNRGGWGEIIFCLRAYRPAKSGERLWKSEAWVKKRVALK